jgi:uncharacterized protein (AIM24 family)
VRRQGDLGRHRLPAPARRRPVRRRGVHPPEARGGRLAFVHAGGTIVSRQLAAGEVLRVDTGCLVAFEQQVDYDIQTVSGIKTAIFGGEGLFFAR